MATLLGIDFETTGLNPESDKIIEVGLCLWDIESQSPLQMSASIIKQDLQLPQEITDLTGINQSMLNNGDLEVLIHSTIVNLVEIENPLYLVAHNATFEDGFLKQINKTYDPFGDYSYKWIDTKTDLPYPPMKGKGTLNDIAMCHGVYNIMPHRALPDVLTMMQVLAQYDFAEVERYAQSPTVNLIVALPYDPTGQKQSAIRSLGYYWKPEGKYWYKPVKEFKADSEIEVADQMGFDVNIERGGQ